jgi:hypothetical protein
MALLINFYKWPTWVLCVVLVGFVALSVYMDWDERH